MQNNCTFFVLLVSEKNPCRGYVQVRMTDMITSVPRICTCPLCGCVNVRDAD
ncbi:hypothetical protein [uncultured Treponema sp.]|uniref:hypothetical protein n=1 Tax=uncultured Treponema sp. TaxID=162155 RepID=UPI0025DF98EE|nr:hypothetical protein [uncultured Treponema sp.]